ncbi:MAG TPA: hypothetical protein VGE93_04255 [Bryobacteraceae bacterium]
MRVLVLLLAAAVLLFGETTKLYLKDGGYHIVREYHVEGDRVRFYSTERGQWEEMPLSLVDINKTETEHKRLQEETQKEAREIDEEEKAERALRHEIESIPMNSGAYYKGNGAAIKELPAAEYQVVTNKTRKALTYLSPIPIIPGKATVVIKGDHSAFTIHEPRPEFYLRLAKEERFGIIQLTPKKNARLVENISILPVANENYEERKQMPTFEQQMQDNLYKVWPEKPLTPGEYALVEYAEGEVDLLIWDFAVK